MPDDVAEDRVTNAISAGVPWLYFNGFQIGLSGGDVLVVAERNAQPVAMFNVSYTVAKTLALALSSVIRTLEEKAGREIMTTHDVDSFMGSADGPKQ